MFFDIEVDVCSFGERNDFTGEGCVVPFEPFYDAEILDLFGGLPDGEFLLVLFDCDDVACFDKVRGDVYSLAVDGDMTVVDNLTSHGTAGTETETVNDVVKSSLDEFEHQSARNTAHFGRYVVVHKELLLADAVISLGFLLFAELQGITGSFLSALAVLSGRSVFGQKRALGRIAFLAFEIKFAAFASAKTAICTCIFSHK